MSGMDSSKSLLTFARERKGLSQADMATVLDVTQPTISNWENGHVPHPSLWPDIAKAYGVKVASLVKHFGETKAAS